MDEKLRNQITRYSFILTIFVIWLHAGEPLLCSIPGQIAVPGFFLLSGFLFFLIPAEKAQPEKSAEKMPPEAPAGREQAEKLPEKEQPEIRRRIPGWLVMKLRRRVHTLLVPYLLWNLLYFLIYLAAGKAELSEISAAVFHYSCNPVFWYLCQLILIMLLTPLLWLLLERKRVAVCWLVFIFLAAVFYGPIHRLIPVGLINEDALFYFSVGGFASIYLNKEEKEKGAAGASMTGDRLRFLCCLGILLLSELSAEFLPPELINFSVILTRLGGALALWFLLKLLPSGKIRPCMRITFFVYATHYMVIRAVWQAEIFLGLNESAAANIATYLLMPGLCIGAAWILYGIMKKYTPKLLGLLTGGRG